LLLHGLDEYFKLNHYSTYSLCGFVTLIPGYSSNSSFIHIFTWELFYFTYYSLLDSPSLKEIHLSLLFCFPLHFLQPQVQSPSQKLDVGGTPVIPALGRFRQVHLKSKVSQNYTAKPYLKPNQNRTKNLQHNKNKTILSRIYFLLILLLKNHRIIQYITPYIFGAWLYKTKYFYDPIPHSSTQKMMWEKLVEHQNHM
jgi:hypothetical protein